MAPDGSQDRSSRKFTPGAQDGLVDRTGLDVFIGTGTGSSTAAAPGSIMIADVVGRRATPMRCAQLRARDLRPFDTFEARSVVVKRCDSAKKSGGAA